MKKFLLKIALYAGISFVMAIALDYAICRGLLNMEDYRFQDYKAMLDGEMNNDVLIMGNSRGKSHYDTQVIDSLCNVDSYSIGIGGYPINVQLMKYAIYRAHCNKPSIIIQNIDYMTVDVMEDVRHQHQSEQFFPLFYDKTGRRWLKSMGYGFLELYIPLYRMYGYHSEIKSGLLEFLHIKHYVSQPAYKGFRPEYGEWDGTELKKMESHRIELSENAKSLLEDYIETCSTDSIRVILVNSPMYIGAIDKLNGYDDAQEYFKNLADRLGITFMDYTRDYRISQDSTNFCVSVHLNSVATKDFTTQLCNNLDSILVLKTEY